MCRYSDGWESVSADQFGEQTYIRQGKCAGGLKGISTNAYQVAVWVASFPICSQLIDTFADMYPSNDTETHEANSKNHKEEGTKRRQQLEAADRRSMRTELQKYSHPLTSSSDHLYNTITGQVATADVNTHQTVEVGPAMRDDLIASYQGGYHHTISSKVKTMQSMKRTATVNNKPVYDLDALFGRLLIVGQKRDISTADLFNYELAPVPPSLTNDYGCLRKSDKSILIRKLGSTIASPSDPDILLIDGNQLLYLVVWPLYGTVENIASSIKARLGTLSYKVYVIFDRYDGVSAKDHERLRRSGDGSRPYHLAINTPLPARKDVMGIKDNKRQLIQLLCTFHISEKAELVSYLDCMARHDDADITLISYMLHAVREGAHRVRIQCDDTDVFVLQVYWSWKANVEADVRFEKWDGAVLSINDTVVSLGAKCKCILATHALCGCDPTSFPCGRGKTVSLNVLMDNGFEYELDATFGEEEVTHDQIIQIGLKFVLALYAQKQSPTLNAARYAIFRKSKNAPPLKNLPPTDCNALIHFQRVHGQCGKTRPSYWRHICM